jgi:hypothetical protein
MLSFLPCLDERNTTWSWSFDEAAGLSGGDYTVDLAEIDPGVSWALRAWNNVSTPVVASGIVSSAAFGLPGVSQIYDASTDPNIKFGEIIDTAANDDTTIRVRDVRGLATHLATVPALLWIGHEAVLVTEYADDGDAEMTLTVTRGLLRTRPQAHVAPEYASMGEYVSTAPLGGVVGRPCCLWAFPSDDDGVTYGAPTLIAPGKVSQGIRIEDGIARVQCLGPLSWLKSPSTSVDYSGHLYGYALQRGEIGTSPSITYGPAGYHSQGMQSSQLRSPHIVMRETWYDIATDSVKNHWSQIWLCGKVGAVTFGSVTELVQAVQDELDKCSSLAGAAWESQYSGDDSTDNPRQSLKYSYKVTSHGISRRNASDSTSYRHTIPIYQTAVPLGSMIGGPIPSIFGLSLAWSMQPRCVNNWYYNYDEVSWELAINNGLVRATIARNLADGVTPYTRWGSYYVVSTSGVSTDVPGPYMQWVPPYDLIEDLYTMSSVLGMEGQFAGSDDPTGHIESVYHPRYYYEFSSAEASDPCGLDVGGNWLAGSWAVPIDGLGNPTLYIDPDDGGIPATGASVQLGNKDYGPRLEGTISASGIVSSVWYVEISSLYGAYAGTYGMNTTSGTDVFSRTYSYNYPCLCWIPILADDPWGFSQGAAPQSSDSVIDMLQGALGFGSQPLAPSSSLSWVPDVDGISDGYSWIDWTDLEESIVPITADERYVFRAGDQSFLDTFFGFLRSHALVPYLELTSEANYDFWIMRFRPVGMTSVTDAYAYGRRIDDGIVQLGTSARRDVGAGDIYSALKVKLSFDGNDYQVNLDVSDKSAYAQHGYGRKSFTIDDRMTVCKSLEGGGHDKKTQAAIISRFVGGLLRHVAKPRAATSARCTMRALARLPVGAVALATDGYGKHPVTGTIGYTEQPAVVTKLSMSLGTMAADVAFALSLSSSKGWAPALRCVAGSIHDEGGGTCLINAGVKKCNQHEFSGQNDPVDLSRFDCVDYDRFNDVYTPRVDSCGDYQIMITAADDQNGDTIHFGTIRVNPAMTATESTQTATIYGLTGSLSIDGSNNTNIDYIIQFGLYAGSQSCQRAQYLGYCDDDGMSGDGNASDRWQ